MTRKIRFRAWDKKLNRIWTEELVTLPIADLNRKDLEIMQFTGLRDKNGVEIYEGDILKQHGYTGEVGEVKFGDGKFYCTKGSEWGWIEEDTEIIGNIYQNPELLK